jgi:hypothetical protein
MLRLYAILFLLQATMASVPEDVAVIVKRVNNVCDLKSIAYAIHTKACPGHNRNKVYKVCHRDNLNSCRWSRGNMQWLVVPLREPPCANVLPSDDAIA